MLLDFFNTSLSPEDYLVSAVSPVNLRIISGLRKTSIKRYIVGRTNKAEIRPEEPSEKAESCRESLWNETQVKGPCRQKRTQ